MEIKKRKNFIDKPSRKGKMTNVPINKTGNQSSGKLTSKGQVYRNDLLDTDLTSQTATRRKLRGM